MLIIEHRLGAGCLYIQIGFGYRQLQIMKGRLNIEHRLGLGRFQMQIGFGYIYLQIQIGRLNRTLNTDQVWVAFRYRLGLGIYNLKLDYVH